jgi:AAA+ ATPase superfamily predicted ATPase
MIIGRDKEQRELHEAYESEYSEFAVVYGRREIKGTGDSSFREINDLSLRSL